MHIISPRPTRLHHDHETFSEVDLRKTGVSKYSRDPSTEILMTGFALDDGPVQQWVPVEGQEMPAQLEDSLLDERIKKYAWNAQFERYIWKFTAGIDIPINQWRDPMVMAYSASLPGKLLKCGEVLKLDPEYLKKDGHRLINWFSKLRPATKLKPKRRVQWWEKYDLWQEYLDYNIWDVMSERKIYRILRKYDLPDHEWELWYLDQEINERGIPINMDMCDNILRARDTLLDKRLDEMGKITGLDNPNSNAQLLPWLQEQGYVFDDMKAAHIKRGKEILDDQITIGDVRPEEVKDLWRVLELRAEVAKTSVKKFDALESHTDDDGRIRNCFQFCAAGRTWRWGGRVIQPQNLAKPVYGLDGLEWGTTASGFEYVSGGTQIDAARLLETLDADGLEMIFDNPIDAMSGAVRTVIQAPPGYVFIDADLRAIENVVLGWLASDRKILSVFESGRDPYVDFATYLYGKSYKELWDEYKAGDKKKRTVSKPGVLGCLKGDTPILTHKGWKALVEVKSDDWLHDGQKWVRHGGVAWKGYQEVLCRFGLHATSDHRFLTNGGWEEWQQVSQQQTFKSALDMGSGVFLKTEGLQGAPESYFFASANVVENESYRDQTSCEDYPHVAPDALRLTVAPNSERESARSFTTYSQIVSMLRDRVAKTRKTVNIATTEVGELLVDSIPLTSGFDIQWMSSARTVSLKFTESTTMETMSKGTSGSHPDQSKTQIADTWDILNTGDYARFAVLTEEGCLVSHNCGYMLGEGHEFENKQTGEIEATGLLGYAWNMGIKLTQEESSMSVKVWRDTYKDAVKFWYKLQDAAFQTMRTKEETVCGHVSYDTKGAFLRTNLPSGRSLHYMKPRIESVLAPWGKYKNSLTYDGLNDKNQWVRTSTHPGKLTENVDQAIARDLLADGMMKAAKNGIPIVMHVHDQILGLVREEEAEERLQVLIECMTDLPPWAKGMPVGAAGHISKWFVKD